jgi:hypothetical protein
MLSGVRVEIDGMLDRGNPVRDLVGSELALAFRSLA